MLEFIFSQNWEMMNAIMVVAVILTIMYVSFFHYKHIKKTLMLVGILAMIFAVYVGITSNMRSHILNKKPTEVIKNMSIYPINKPKIYAEAYRRLQLIYDDLEKTANPLEASVVTELTVYQLANIVESRLAVDICYMQPLAGCQPDANPVEHLEESLTIALVEDILKMKVKKERGIIDD